MRVNRKNIQLHDGVITDFLKGGNSVQVELKNGYYDGNGSKQYVKENVTLRLDNPAQTEGLKEGDKVAVFKDGNGKVNLVRDGEWKSSGPVMVAGKKDPSKQYDNGVTVIMGRCSSMRLVTPQDPAKKPFLSVNLSTADRVQHHISIYNREPYEADAIEKTMERFKEYMANEEHAFIPFTGTFITGNAYSEGEHEYNGKNYQDRSYFGMIYGAYNDYEKAQAYQPRSQEAAAEQTQEAPSTSMDQNADLADEGFVNIPDDLDEELPFN